MRRSIAVVAVLACVMAAWAPPTSARLGVRGTLAVKLSVDRGGPRGHRPGPARIKLLLVVKGPGNVTIVRTEAYVLSGRTLAYVLPPGRYRISATSLPPVVNPTARPCKVSPSTVGLSVGQRVETGVRCTLIG
jgi:hypothetical protein